MRCEKNGDEANRRHESFIAEQLSQTSFLK